MWVFFLIDPLEGQIYVKPIKSEGQEGNLDTIYNITSAMDDYINPTTDGKLSWKIFSSCLSDSSESLKNW